MRQRLAPLALTAVLLAAALAGALAFAVASRGDDADKGYLASLVSRALSTPATQVSIGDVEGALSSDVTIRDVVITDREGVWLRLDRLKLVWRRLALLSRRLEVDRLEIGKLEILRKPLPADAPVAASNEPLLPELPVKVEIKEFNLRELILGEPILGVAAGLSASGAASLGDPTEGLALRLDAKRLGAPGTFAARLSLVPQTQALSVKLGLDEPAGGLVARAGGIPGLPPVKLDVNGQGTLDQFAAQLVFDAGDAIGANGQAQLRREGPARRLGLDLAARVEGLLPQLVAPVFAGTTRLTGDTVFADDGAIAIERLALASNTAKLDASGRLTANKMLDLTVSAGAVPGSAGKTLAGSAEIKKLAFDGTVSGPLSGPRIGAKLAAEDARLPAGRLGSLQAIFTATPNGPLSEPATRIAVVADAKANGVALTDPALAKAIGQSLTLALKANAAPDGQADVETLTLSTATIEARYAGRLGARDVAGKLAVEAPDLSRFGDVAAMRLRGALNAAVELAGQPRDGRMSATVDARASRFATGIAALDGLIDGRLAAAGTLRTLPHGGYGFQKLTLTGAHVTAIVDGDATVEKAAIDARVSLPDLKRADARLTGKGEMTARLTGTVEHPDATARISLTDATALGRPVPRLAIEAVVADLTGLLDARATMAGEVDRKPATAALHVARQAQGGWRVDTLDATIGSANLRGNATLDARNLATGQLHVAARNLDDLSPLLLTRLAGDIDADISLDGANGRQDAKLTARGASLKAGAAAIEKLDARATVADLYGRPVINAAVAVDQAIAAGETISKIRLDANGDAGGSNIVLTALARGFDLDVRGRLIPEERLRFDLATLTARRGARRLALTRPATFVLGDGGVDMRGVELAIDAGRVSIEGRAGSRLDLKLAAKAVPLAAADIAVPNLGLSGTLDADARLGGAASRPEGDWKLRIAGLVAPQTREAGLPPINVTANGRLDGGRSSVDANVDAGRVGSLRVKGDVPLGGPGALALNVRGQVDAAAAANSTLGAAGRRVTGTATIDLAVAGTMAAPVVNGSLALAGGSFSDAELGLRLDAIQARVIARGDDITVEQLSATTRNGGTLAVSGRVKVDPGAGFPGAIRITGRKAQLASNNLVSASADLDLDLSGALARDPRISGRVGIVGMDVTVPDRLPTTSRPIEGTRHIRPTRTAKARLAIEAKARAQARRAPPFNAVLDLLVAAPNRIFVRGRGIDAELGGEVKITGTLADPVPIGGFDLRRGRLSILGIRLDFARGRLAFSGQLTPELDFLAQTRAGDVTAMIGVTGPASQPAFAFSSDPALPQEEVLSRLLFQKASGGLSPGQALQLAQAAAQFAGDGSGGDAFEKLRKSLGVDSLDISMGASGAPSVGLSRAISDRVSIGVKAGATPEQSGVSVDVDVTKRIRVQGEVGANGSTSVGVGAEWEY